MEVSLLEILQFILTALALAFLAIVIYLGSILLCFFLNFLKTRKSLPDLPRTSVHPSEVPVFVGFAPDYTRKFLEEFLDDNGTLRKSVAHFGPHLDGKVVVAVADGEALKDILTEQKFPKLELVYDSLSLVLGHGLVVSKGDHWKAQRRLLTPIFHFKNLSRLPEIIANRSEEFCDWLKSKAGEELYPSREFGTLTLRIIIDAVFGGKEFVDAEVMGPHWEILNEDLNLFFLTNILFGDTANGLLPFPWNRTVFKKVQAIRDLVKVSIQKKREFIKQLTGDELSDSGDLLTSLLSVKDESGKPMPDEYVIDEAVTFLFAGHDTTSSLLAWSMTFLSRHPEVVEKIREEYDRVIGPGNLPNHTHIKNLHYVEAVVRETLRMRPPVPILDRYAATDTKICGYDIPAGTYILPILIASHYDNRFWKEPFKFRPERWDPSNTDEPTRPSHVFVPFSAGTRNCIGQKFAIMEAVSVIASIVNRFDIQTSTKPEEDSWSWQGTVKPLNFKCQFRERVL